MAEVIEDYEAVRNEQHGQVRINDDAIDEGEDLEEVYDEAGDREAADAADAQTNNVRPPLSLDSPGRMNLSEEERNLAINIKEAIAAAPDVDSVSDFMCVQLALIDGDNTDAAIERVHHLQCFREEYGILDSAQDGVKCFGDYMKLFPGFHLCFSYYHDSGSYVMIYDNTKFEVREVRSPERIHAWLGGSYYTCTIFCPDFEAIRNGTVLVVECEGYDWKTDMDFKSLKKVWSEVATVYPVCFDKVKYFNASSTMNVVVSMLKPFLPKHLRNNIEFGCQFEQRLDALYLVPSMEEANQRLLARVDATLQRRYENERTFRL
ncbi:expressed unknown protein [Seminavis robusta]|uniref:CRAL-TRIO domain-containing protein n=1 Tax=Seminavis robusta TaxID=568900 RepID=A0A9N8DNP6_9STRA|nr:expressed unknown protein [Seminavis robusta]|eukprot:Sro156_g070870.1 n/a (320) ;mRNA; r:66433-67476